MPLLTSRQMGWTGSAGACGGGPAAEDTGRRPGGALACASRRLVGSHALSAFPRLPLFSPLSSSLSPPPPVHLISPSSSSPAPCCSYLHPPSFLPVLSVPPPRPCTSPLPFRAALSPPFPTATGRCLGCADRSFNRLLTVPGCSQAPLPPKAPPARARRPRGRAGFLLGPEAFKLSRRSRRAGPRRLSRLSRAADNQCKEVG